MLEHAVGNFDHDHFSPTGRGGRDARIKPVLDLVLRHPEARRYSNVGEIKRGRAATLEAVEITERSGSGCLDACRRIAGLDQAMRKAGCA